MRSTRIGGGLLVAAGLAVPGIAYFIGLELLAREASLGGPPNQGAMVLASFWFVGACIVGFLLAVSGLIVLVRSLRAARRDQKTRGKPDVE